MAEQVIERIDRDVPLDISHRGVEFVVADGECSSGTIAVTKVDTVDSQRGELSGHGVDLAKKVLRGEASLPQCIRRGVRGGSDTGTAVDELGQQPGHQPGVARIVQLELVDADQGGPPQGLDSFGITQGTNQSGVLDEGAEVLSALGLVPERGQ